MVLEAVYLYLVVRHRVPHLNVCRFRNTIRSHLCWGTLHSASNSATQQNEGDVQTGTAPKSLHEMAI